MSENAPSGERRGLIARLPEAYRKAGGWAVMALLARGLELRAVRARRAALRRIKRVRAGDLVIDPDRFGQVDFYDPWKLIDLEVEEPEQRCVQGYLRPELPVVLLGGSIGVLACMVNRLLDDPSQHLVVEPDPGLAKAAERNRDLNGCRFEMVQAAVAYGCDEVRFAAAESPLAGRLSSGAGGFAVPATTVSALLQRRNWNRVNLICDIEGAEIAMVAHEADTIGGAAEVLILEQHAFLGYYGQEALCEAVSRLEAAGMVLAAEDDSQMVFLRRPEAPMESAAARA